MSDEFEFYQIGGFKGHTDEWDLVESGDSHRYHDYKLLSKNIWNTLTTGEEGTFSDPKNEEKPGKLRPERGLELILGMKSSGASYLLMSGTQMHTIARAAISSPLRHPYHVSDFASLSPILFTSYNEFQDKVNSYKLKPGKKRKGLPYVDDSRANKAYIDNVIGLSRPAFEQQRVFCRLLKGELSDSWKFGLTSDAVSSARSARIMSLVFHTWSIIRSKEERERDPKLLDAGVIEVSPHDLSPVRQAHFLVAENARLQNKLPRKPYQNGETRKLERQALCAMFSQIFQSSTAASHSPPIILLVYDEESTLNILKYYGVDTSAWVSSVGPLLYQGHSREYEDGFKREGSNRRSFDDRPRGSYDNSRRHSRSRSPKRDRTDATLPPRHRSPPTRGGLSRDGTPSSLPDRPGNSAEDRKPEAREGLPPVMIVDVRSLFSALMDRNISIDRSMFSIAQELSILTADDGYCAGNDCLLLIKMWRHMIEGPSIDEQRAIRQAAAGTKPAPVVPEVPPGDPDPASDDDDFDPNAVAASRQYMAAAVAAPVRDIYDEDDDDDEDL